MIGGPQRGTVHFVARLKGATRPYNQGEEDMRSLQLLKES